MNDCPKDCHKKAPFIFRKVVIPASVDDDSKNPPKNGAYHNAIVYYEATENAYIYSSDGIPTKVSASLSDVSAMIAKAVGDEAEIRSNADQEIWTEIETIEASSDVVDVVGTYAELQQYDTSKLKDNDIIKVLQDETRDDAITYYRWSTSTDTFTYVGAEGPYYTASEVDTLLGGKQNTLTAGSNIQINGNTISATDTTYSVMSGASAGSAGTSGLVPAPAAGDQNKALKGDGTWGEVASGTVFYMNAHDSGNTRNLYKAADMTGLVTMQDIINANEEGQVIVRISTSSDPSNYSDMYLQNAYVASGDYQMIFLDNQYYYSFDATQTSDNTFQFAKSEVQRKLTAGTNITINGNTISATDTTYTHFTGATALADGTQGLVPGPLAGDQDKFLKADGTWATVQAGGGTDGTFYISSGLLYAGGQTGIVIYKDMAHTTPATYAEVFAAVKNGNCALSTGVIYDGHIEEQSIYVAVGGAYTDNEDEGSNDILFSDGSGVQYYLDAENGTDPGYPNITASFENQLGGTLYQQALHAGANISIGTVGGVDNTISVTGMPVLYGSQGQNTDGAVTQKVFTDTVGDVESILQILNSGAGV